jgi:hypothetical protein
VRITEGEDTIHGKSLFEKERERQRPRASRRERENSLSEDPILSFKIATEE